MSLPEPETRDVPPSQDDESDGGGGGSVFIGFPGKYGPLKTNIVAGYGGIGLALGGPDSPDGVLFLESAVHVADAWIAWGKSSPNNMKVVKALWGGPLTTLLIAHAPIAAGLMHNHGISLSFLRPGRMMKAMQARREALAGLQATSLPSSGTASPSQAVPPHPSAQPASSFQPLGANAPTEAQMPTPSNYTEGLRVYPDEGIPSDLDVAARRLAQLTGRPYKEVLEDVKLQYNQALRRENPPAVQQPTNNGKGQGLGAPIAKE